MQDQDVRDLISTGRKIEAIKVYRQRYGVGLLEAKNAVEAIEAGRSPSHPQPPTAVPDTRLPQTGQEPAWDEIDRLLQAGNKIQAIKVYREWQNVGLKEAKDAIDARALRHGMGGGTAGCFIATAAFGTSMAPEVEVLRRYRDAVLASSWTGRGFIRAYYRCSPPVANMLRRTSLGCSLVRAALRPLVRLCRRSLHTRILEGRTGFTDREA